MVVVDCGRGGGAELWVLIAMVVVECFDLKFNGGLYGGLAAVVVAHSGANSGHGG